MHDMAQGTAMPIFTPLNPQQCTTFGMTKSARIKIQQELQRGDNICKVLCLKRELALHLGEGDVNDSLSQYDFRIDNGGRDARKVAVKEFLSYNWSELFKPEQFFLNHEVFLEIQLLTLYFQNKYISQWSKILTEVRDHGTVQARLDRHQKLQGHVESRLKSLQQSLQNAMEDEGVQIHIEPTTDFLTPQKASQMLRRFKVAHHRTIIYFGLSCSDLTIKDKNVIFANMSQWMQTSLDPILEPHCLKYSMSKFEHLPGAVYQKCLDRLAPTHKLQKFGVKERISMRELYRRIMTDPELYHKCKLHLKQCMFIMRFTIYQRPAIK